MFHRYIISNCGDHAITIEFGDTINISTHQKVMALFNHLCKENIAGVKDIIPAYTTVTVVYDIMKAKQQTAASASGFISSEIEKAIQQCHWNEAATKSLIEIPVCYDTSLGVDLEGISKQKKLNVDEIVEIHSSTVYDVYMLGFLPGFAYMGIVDDKIATPRLSKPRTNVAASSVGIAGNQTGIYPLDSPGGWNIIGQTSLKMFDMKKNEPCLLKPGDKVKFVPISLDEFNICKQI